MSQHLSTCVKQSQLLTLYALNTSTTPHSTPAPVQLKCPIFDHFQPSQHILRFWSPGLGASSTVKHNKRDVMVTTEMLC